jgi:uncharacterized repeat protein (TIGR03803 family)
MIDGFGTIFRIKVDGTSFTLLHAFAGGVSDGVDPEAGLIRDGFGNFFGTTTQGGASGAGTVFTIKADGSGFQVLHSFVGGASEGSVPYAALSLNATGDLFGTTADGGPSDLGTLFKLRTDGTGFQILHFFAGGAGDGKWPRASLLLDDSGNIYGTTLTGGHPAAKDAFGNVYDGSGTLFKLRADGTGFQLLRAFPVETNDATTPWGSLILDGSGELYGTTVDGGSPNAGTIFSIGTDGSHFQVRFAFAGFANNGGNPRASLISDELGYLYGTTAGGGSAYWGTVYRIKSDGSGFQLLHAFRGGDNDEAGPLGALILDEAGYLFGTTSSGGASGFGTVFRMKTDGSGFQILHAFIGGAGDGVYPSSGLVLDGAGNLFGTTMEGGPNYAGTVYGVRTDGTGFRILHTFGADAASGGGNTPIAALVLDGSGNLYGTTLYGGSGLNGTVFALKTDGSDFRVLHSFTGGTNDGSQAWAPLMLDGLGELYGTTEAGGAFGDGAVFKLKVDGSDFQLLHSFTGDASDGGLPIAAVILDGFGNLYGTTDYGGSSGAGTVFTVKTDGTGFRILHAFGADTSDGQHPAASLFLDKSGFLIGTTDLGGVGNFGTVFALSPGRNHEAVMPGPLLPVRKH